MELKEIFERLSKLETRVEQMASNIDDIKSNHLHTIEEKIDNIVTGRPSWSVSIIITLLTSAVVGLLITLIKF